MNAVGNTTGNAAGNSGISKEDLRDIMRSFTSDVNDRLAESSERFQQELRERNRLHQEKMEEMAGIIESLKTRSAEKMSRKEGERKEIEPEEEEDLIEMSLYPFSEAIRKAKLHPFFVAPAIEKYDGTGDPAQHIKKFIFAMNTQGISSQALCNLFPGTLTKRAVNWISTRRPQSIISFKQLTEEFQTYFAASKKIQKDTIELMDVRQKKDETVKEYNERFHKVVAEIDDVDEKILVKAFANGLAHPRLAGRIATRAPQTHGELAKMLHEFLKAEKAENKAKELVSSFKTTDKKATGGASTSGSGQAAKSASSGWNQRYKPYGREEGKLNYGARAVHIAPERYAAAVKEGHLPPSRRPARGESPIEFCEFHGQTSHRTTNCTTLALELNLIDERKKAKGKQVTSGGSKKQSEGQARYGTGRGESNNRANNNNRETHPELDHSKSFDFGVITGLFSETEPLTTKEKKRHVHEVHEELPPTKVQKKDPLPPVYLSEEDAAGVYFPHNDPLVIRVQIKDRMVGGILVDSGAGANVISLEAFRKLEIPEERVKPFSAVFGEFIGGITAQASGCVDVTMTLGQGDDRRTEKLTLYIMRDLSGYNVYLGRHGINAFQAVCSMYYLKLKFLTRTGRLVTIPGSPEDRPGLRGKNYRWVPRG